MILNTMFLYWILILCLNINTFVYGILGGIEIDIRQAPYQVNYGDICGGVLIHQKWVITTAHCGTKDFVRIGSNHRLRGKEVQIIRHIVHPMFGKMHMFDFDIQLLELKKRLRITDRVQPVDFSDEIFGGFIYVAGWGYPKEKGDFQPILHQVKLNTISIWKCQNIGEKWYNHTLTGRMFCAEGRQNKDACQGDSGGAAISVGRLVGISSFGYGCGRNYPGVYINVTESHIRRWITNHTGLTWTLIKGVM